MRALVYIRVSTDEQAQSAETQERGALAWCAAQGHAVVETVRDVGYSGAEWVRRPGIAALQLAAASGRPPWDLVVVRDVDRLGRDGVRLPYLLATLREAGVDVVEYSTGQTVALDGVGQLVASVRACVAQIEREQIAHRTRTAHRQQHLDRRVVGGTVYGYRNVRGPGGVRYAIEEREAAVVREIYERAARGEGTREIARTLNARRELPPSAGRRGTGSWSPAAVLEILRRERYRGVLVWGATTRRYRGGTRSRVEGTAPVRVEAPDLALVSGALWEAAQPEQQPGRHRPDRPARARHLLVGFAVCDGCGGPIATTHTRQGTETVAAYCCGWARDRGICEARWRRWTERVNGVVLRWLAEEVLDGDVVADAVAIARARLADDAPDPRLAELAEREREGAAAVARLVAAVEAGAGDLPELVARLRERQGELERARQERAALAGARALLPRDLDSALAAVVADLRGALARDTEGARRVLGAVLVGRLRVSVPSPRAPLTLSGSAELGGVVSLAVTRGDAASPAGPALPPRPSLALIPVVLVA